MTLNNNSKFILYLTITTEIQFLFTYVLFQVVLQTALKILAKVGLFFTSGLALLILGGILTTAFCSLTPLCTVTFNGFNAINKDTMRSYMTPDKIAATAAFVQDAVGKYERLQRAVNGNRN